MHGGIFVVSDRGMHGPSYPVYIQWSVDSAGADLRLALLHGIEFALAIVISWQSRSTACK